MVEVQANVEDILPTWLDNAFLGRALRSGENDHSIIVVSSDIKRATALGDHYASEMYRVVVHITRNGKNEEISIIIKAKKSKRNGFLDELLEKSDMFDKEINTFTLIIPVMYRILNGATIGPYQPFAAKYFYCHKDNSTTALVFEDLKKQGFTLAKTMNGLDFNHCLLVLRSIARYHATSLVMHHKNPDFIKQFLQNVYVGKNAKEFALMLSYNINLCADEVATWPDDHARFAAKLKEFSEKVVDLWICGIKRNESTFNVLTHGDLWMNNFMFRYSDDTGKVMDVRFVDFQMSHWTTPAVDLHYFLYSSASVGVLEKVDIFIKEYHIALCKTLCQLGHSNLQPTFEQLNKELNKRGKFAVICGTALRAGVFRDRSEASIMKLGDDFKMSLRKLLTIYEERGWM